MTTNPLPRREAACFRCLSAGWTTSGLRPWPRRSRLHLLHVLADVPLPETDRLLAEPHACVGVVFVHRRSRRPGRPRTPTPTIRGRCRNDPPDHSPNRCKSRHDVLGELRDENQPSHGATTRAATQQNGAAPPAADDDLGEVDRPRRLTPSSFPAAPPPGGSPARWTRLIRRAGRPRPLSFVPQGVGPGVCCGRRRGGASRLASAFGRQRRVCRVPRSEGRRSEAGSYLGADGRRRLRPLVRRDVPRARGRDRRPR